MLSHDGFNEVLILLADHLTRARGCSSLFFAHEAMCFAQGASVDSGSPRTVSILKYAGDAFD
jgi:hypothetical protein